MDNYTETEIELAAQVGALRYACGKALDLLEDAIATEEEARKVAKLLYAVLNASFPLPQSGAFVAGTETIETGGNCPVDLVHLHNGLIIGVDNETAVLYTCESDVYDYEKVDRPSFSVFKK